MRARRNCCQCGKPFWLECGYLVDRENVTCGEQACRTAQKTKRQKERRYEARMKRLSEKAARKATGKPARKRKRKHIAKQYRLPLKPRPRKALKVAA